MVLQNPENLEIPWIPQPPQGPWALCGRHRCQQPTFFETFQVDSPKDDDDVDDDDGDDDHDDDDDDGDGDDGDEDVYEG